MLTRTSTTRVLMPSRVLTLSREELSMKQGRVAMPSRVSPLPHHQDVGNITTNDVKTVHVGAKEKSAVEMYYVKSAMGKYYKTDRYLELPRHRALSPSRCPEDWMGEVIVEYPVVFPSSSTTRYGSSSEVPAS